MYITHTHCEEKEGGGGRQEKMRGREGETEKERRKRENKHAPNRFAIEREGKKAEGREKRTVPKEKHKKIKEKKRGDGAREGWQLQKAVTKIRPVWLLSVSRRALVIKKPPLFVFLLPCPPREHRFLEMFFFFFFPRALSVVKKAWRIGGILRVCVITLEVFILNIYYFHA